VTWAVLAAPILHQPWPASRLGRYQSFYTWNLMSAHTFSLHEPTGEGHGFRTWCVAVVNRRAAADHHSSGVVLALRRSHQRVRARMMLTSRSAFRRQCRGA
jgi:hypothetical protein